MVTLSDLHVTSPSDVSLAKDKRRPPLAWAWHSGTKPACSPSPIPLSTGMLACGASRASVKTMSICMQMLFRGSGVPSCHSTEEVQASVDWGSASPNAQPAEAVAPPATAAAPAPGSAKRKRKASPGAAGGVPGVGGPNPKPAEAPAPPAGAEAELAPAKRARSGPETLPGDPADQSAQVAEALKVTAQVAGSSGVISSWLSGRQCLQPQCILL